MNERIIHTGLAPSPITLDVTCSQCFRTHRYDAPLTGVINQLLTDEGWRFPGTQQICPTCMTKYPLVGVKPAEGV